MHTSQLEAGCAPCATPTSLHTASFAELFKNLRKQLVGKQACLSRAGLRCTDAAISHWERGLRLPRPKTLRNAVEVLTQLGATPTDIEQLITAWTTEYLEKKGLGRHPPSRNPAAAFPS
ncbi:MAG TPA: helix-turn-helix transcriptional regulator [Polyangiaceae bacterium]|nr:helix-turn-helix transcriptional regulator [Polyangiaceae bacterium]